MVTQHAHTGRSEFLEEVIEATPGGERMVHCLQCGSCGGSCPNGADMQHTPRTLFAMINANRKEEARPFYRKIVTQFDQTNAPSVVQVIVRGSKLTL